MRVFYALVHKDEDSAYGVTFPDLPGCFSAADSDEDISVNASQALELYFEDAAEVVPSRVTEIVAPGNGVANVADRRIILSAASTHGTVWRL